MFKKRIIVALDSNNLKRTLQIVKSLKNEVFAYKIGYEFFFNFGLTGYNSIKKISPKIFLDLKLHDIPNTVLKGMKAINKLQPIMTTIHICGGDEMMKVSKINASKTKILGVTILTSLNDVQTKKYFNENKIKRILSNKY